MRNPIRRIYRNATCTPSDCCDWLVSLNEIHACIQPQCIQATSRREITDAAPAAIFPLFDRFARGEVLKGRKWTKQHLWEGVRQVKKKILFFFLFFFSSFFGWRIPFLVHRCSTMWFWGYLSKKLECSAWWVNNNVTTKITRCFMGKIR